MTLFDSRSLARFQYLSLLTRQAGGRSLLAAPKRKLPAGGTEVTGLRDYSPGDDIRHVDWRWAARRDELLTKVFAGDVDLHAYILLDCSPSMGLGRPPKFQLARRIAAALGYVSLLNMDRLGVTAFAGGMVAGLPLLRGKTRIPALLQFLEHLSLQGTQTDLERAAGAFCRRCQRPGPVVVLSDLYDRRGFRRGLDALLHHGYEPRVVQIVDPGEADARALGDVELSDVESGASREVTITERAAARYRTLYAEFQDSVRRYCAERHVVGLQVACDAPEEETLLRVLGARGERASTSPVI
jgi:uncharacterized protein (DUF58 family)